MHTQRKLPAKSSQVKLAIYFFYFTELRPCSLHQALLVILDKLHPQTRCGPMTKIEGREPFMQAMTGLAKAWKSDHKRIRAIGNGEDAALLYDFVMTEPIKQTVRMTEWYRVRNGKIDEIRLLFDTAKFTPPDGM